MQLLLVRHAIAVDRSTAIHPDDDYQRPLTSKGRQRMREIAVYLNKLVPQIDLLATSPLLRTVQTAEILAQSFGNITPTKASVLSPGQGSDEIKTWLTSLAPTDESTYMLVGHEPDLSQLVGWLSVGVPKSVITLKKGASCLLQCKTPLEAGTCMLQWLLSYRQINLLTN